MAFSLSLSLSPFFVRLCLFLFLFGIPCEVLLHFSHCQSTSHRIAVSAWFEKQTSLVELSICGYCRELSDSLFDIVLFDILSFIFSYFFFDKKEPFRQKIFSVLVDVCQSACCCCSMAALVRFYSFVLMGGCSRIHVFDKELTILSRNSFTAFILFSVSQYEHSFYLSVCVQVCLIHR